MDSVANTSSEADATISAREFVHLFIAKRKKPHDDDFVAVGYSSFELPRSASPTFYNRDDPHSLNLLLTFDGLVTRLSSA
jgi:hypothetical protein